jgi:hypothetical protein
VSRVHWRDAARRRAPNLKRAHEGERVEEPGRGAVDGAIAGLGAQIVELFDGPLEIGLGGAGRRIAIDRGVRQQTAARLIEEAAVGRAAAGRIVVEVDAEAARVEHGAARKALRSGAGRRRIADHEIHNAVGRAAHADRAAEIQRHHYALRRAKVGQIRTASLRQRRRRAARIAVAISVYARATHKRHHNSLTCLANSNIYITSANAKAIHCYT